MVNEVRHEEGNCASGSSRLDRLGGLHAQKQRSRDMSARSYALHSNSIQVSFSYRLESSNFESFIKHVIMICSSTHY